MMSRDPILEVCADTAESLAAAVAGGADRIELCADLAAGGLTPPADFMRVAAGCGRPVHAMIRPRAGDFRSSPADADLMLAAIAAAKAAGLAGVVVGAARADRTLDMPLIGRLVAAARPLSVTLHRVFDEVTDPFAALDAVAALGFDRVLTSGQATTAQDGAETIGRLVAHASGRIVVMAGGGITPANVADIVRRTGVHEVHGSFSRLAEGGNRRADTEIIRAARRAIQSVALETVP